MIGSSRQEQSVDGFISRQEFEQAMRELQEQTQKGVKDGASVTGLEQAYNQLLRFRERAYPLLLFRW